MVYFVGAGCGAADLITVRGKNLLEKADIIIYAGSLVNPQLLEYKKESCVVYNSAKMTLEEIIGVISENREKLIVRLHTGDPSIYGAVREQTDALKGLGIPYEICPGVSSFCGAAAALEAEYTLPGVSQTVIITRMGGRTAVPKRESIRLLAVHHASMVVFLSAGMVDKVAEEMIEGGYEEATPAAVVYKATWDDEVIVKGTLKDIAEKAKKAGITKTALIVAGDFLGNDYELSKLYDKTFETQYRKAVTMNNE